MRMGKYWPSSNWYCDHNPFLQYHFFLCRVSLLRAHGTILLWKLSKRFWNIGLELGHLRYSQGSIDSELQEKKIFLNNQEGQPSDVWTIGMVIVFEQYKSISVYPRYPKESWTFYMSWFIVMSQSILSYLCNLIVVECITLQWGRCLSHWCSASKG